MFSLLRYVCDIAIYSPTWEGVLLAIFPKYGRGTGNVTDLIDPPNLYTVSFLSVPIIKITYSA